LSPALIWLGSVASQTVTVRFLVWSCSGFVALTAKGVCGILQCGERKQAHCEWAWGAGGLMGFAVQMGSQD